MWMRLVSGWVLAALFAHGMVRAQAEETPVLLIYTWSDYFDSEVLRDFEREADCRLELSYFDSNESMFEDLQVLGGGFDIIIPSSYMSSIMQRHGLLQPLDHALLTNLKHIDKQFTRITEDPDMAYSVPYTRTVTGVGFNKRAVPAEEAGSWAIFSSGRTAGRMTMLDDMRESLGAALKYLGHSINSTDDRELAEAGEMLADWAKNLDRFDVDEAKRELEEGELAVMHGYNGDVALIMDENPDIDFFVPREGSSLASDDFVICADSPNRELAHAFINYMLRPGVAQRNMESIRYFMPNPEGLKLVDPELRANHAFAVSEEIISRCEVIRDLGDDNAKYTAVWDTVRGME